MKPIYFLIVLILLSISNSAIGQQIRSIHGTVLIEPSGTPVKNASVTISELKRTTFTSEDGTFQFNGVPSGRYQIIAHLDRVPDVVKMVDIGDADLSDVIFRLSLSPVSETVTVTATGTTEAIENSYQTVVSVGSLEISARNPLSIGDALDKELGIAKRSFGPGSGRPVIRGFDGDRVIVLQDGLRVGGIASQAGDEVEQLTFSRSTVSKS